MQTNLPDIHELIRSYLANPQDRATIDRLHQLLEQPGTDAAVKQALAVMLEADSEQPIEVEQPHYDRLFATIVQADQPLPAIPLPAKKSRFTWLYAAAAAVLLLVATVPWWKSSQPSTSTPQVVVQAKGDAQPGKEGAVLTLADGRTVVLDSMGNGTIATQGGHTVALHNGEVVYEPGSHVAGASPQFNTLSTPRGRQFRVQLPDGTNVWLNAASSITYPTVFTGKERKVQITGEAYFEVIHQDIPFVVQVNDRTAVQVLGTHFNINAYTDEEKIATTLLEGKVKVLTAGNSKQVVLLPGEQASITAREEVTIDHEANVAKVMAWKNGVFNFEDAKLKEVMRQLARWYDVDVSYAPNLPDMEFWGKMGRNLSLSQIVKGLEGTGLHFNISANGKQLTVLP